MVLHLGGIPPYLPQAMCLVNYKLKIEVMKRRKVSHASIAKQEPYTLGDFIGGTPKQSINFLSGSTKQFYILHKYRKVCA